MERDFRKSRDYLADAKLNRVEHEAAAERHRTLTQLYAERIIRLEAHLGKTLPTFSDTGNSKRGTCDRVLSAASLP